MTSTDPQLHQDPTAPHDRPITRPNASDTAIQALIQQTTDALVDSYLADDRLQHLDAVFLPNRYRIIDLVEMLRKLIFPGFFDNQHLTQDHIHQHTQSLLHQTHALMFDQVNQALRYHQNREGLAAEACGGHEEQAWAVVTSVFNRLPEIRKLLALDVQAAFDGDPAAISTDETIFCYPGLDAVFIHRIAHEFYNLDLKLMARMMGEYAHNETGIDIHPGAKIGESFFLDHGTGVVVGETATIGNRVKLYQGVTLGALSTKGGQSWRGRRRHPTIEDDVTIYAGATILGGETVIGQGATINGGVFLTNSVPPGVTVGNPPVDLHIRPAKRPKPD